MQNINIGIPIDLQKLLDTRLLIQAGSGGGKSYLTRKLIESIGNQAQQIVIDPEGEFVTLREKFDFALIGKDGDIPISLKYAETLAHKLLETGLSAIVDLYELKQHERIIFVKRFLDAFMNAPKELWHPCFIHLDEAHMFAPETSKSESLSAVIDLCTRGRKRGFAAILATQRLSKLHKDAAAECLNKMIGRTGLDIDRARAGQELGMNNKNDMLQLRDLLPGEFYTFGPAISNAVQKFVVSSVITTHQESGRRIGTKPPVPKAIESILCKLSDIPEEAEKDLETKQQLLTEVTRLRGEVGRLSKTNNVKPGEDGLLLIQGKINKAVDEAKKELNNQHLISIREKERAIKELQDQVRILTHTLFKIGQLAVQPAKDTGASLAEYLPPTKVTITLKDTPKPIAGSVTGGALRMLKAAAMFSPKPISRTRMAALSGLSHSSGSFGTYLSTLKRQLLITGAGNEFEITPAGLLFAGDVDELPTDSDALVEMWCENVGKDSGAARILRSLADVYPQTLSRQAVGDLAGMSSSSGSFGTYLSTLKRNGLIETSGSQLKASDNLFNQ